MTARAAALTARDLKILRLSQAHLAPGMSLERWRQILAKHSALQGWPTAIPDHVLDAIAREISAVVPNSSPPFGGSGGQEVSP